MAKRVTKPVENEETGEQTTVEINQDEGTGMETPDTSGDQPEPQPDNAEDGGVVEDNIGDCDWPIGVDPIEGKAAQKAGLSGFTAIMFRTVNPLRYTVNHDAATGEGDTAEKALKALLKQKGLTAADWDYAQGLADEPRKPDEQQGSNQPVAPYEEPANKEALDRVLSRWAEGDNAIKRNDASNRDEWLSIGGVGDEAERMFKSFTEDRRSVNKKQWGDWLSKAALPGNPLHGTRFTGDSGKNTLKEAIEMYQLFQEPGAAELIPSSMQSPKTVQLFVLKQTNEICKSAAEILYNSKHDAAAKAAAASGEKPEIVTADVKEQHRALDRYIADRKEKLRLAEIEAQKKLDEYREKGVTDAKLNNLLPPADRKNKEAALVYNWRAQELPSLDDPQHDALWVKTKLGGAMSRAWQKVMEEAAAKIAAEQSTATSTEEGSAIEQVARKFADLTAEEQAAQVVMLLRGLEDPMEVLNLAADMIEGEEGTASNGEAADFVDQLVNKDGTDEGTDEGTEADEGGEEVAAE